MKKFTTGQKVTTAQRLKQVMEERRMKQVDILEACKPYCEKYNVLLKKNDLSQYVSGKVEPKQDKLSILGMALNVNEVWLMGYDVPPERDAFTKQQTEDVYDTIKNTFGEQTVKLVRIFTSFNQEGQELLLENADTMEQSGKYKKDNQSKVVKDA